LEAVLRAIAAITPPREHLGNLRLGELVLPSGQSVILPIWTEDECKTLSVAKGETRFETQLLVPLDEDISYFLGDSEASPEEHNGEIFARLGLIYVTVNLGSRYVEISFESASTSMSLLFLESVAIRRMFCQVLETSGGLAGVLNLQGDRILSLLTPGFPEIQGLMPEDAYVWSDDDVLDIDIYTKRLLQAISKAESPVIGTSGS
jgi:hypothetical protein